MNLHLLHTKVQDFINDNLKTEPSKLLLKGIPFTNVDAKAVIEQIEAKTRCKKKLPTWFNTQNIYYPNKLNIEQTSSETTANYKANLISGKSLIDLTGGFGVDAFYFSKTIKNVTHCEINQELSNIVVHNFDALNASSIKCLNNNGIDALKQLDQPFDWIYIDPSRRDDSKTKVFLLSDCAPNVKTHQDVLFNYAEHVMIKTSPLLDISATAKDLKHVKELHVVAINNEVKELLWILERNYNGAFTIKTRNITKTNTQQFNFNFKDEACSNATYSEPLTYLYEPNSAVLKAGAFNSVSALLHIDKLHKHSHLYTSSTLFEFPGRRFKIDAVMPFNKKAFAKLNLTKANVTTRNFPLSVIVIRKKLKLKDGGDTYLFFTTSLENEKLIIVCSKV